MSGYVPHDDDVQMAYIHGASQDYPVAGRADALRAEFYRWLAEHDRQVKAEAWDRCVGEMPMDPDWKNFYGDNNPYRKGEEA